MDATERERGFTESDWDEERDREITESELEEEQQRIRSAHREDILRSLRSRREPKEPRRRAPVIPRFMRRPVPQKLWQAVAERRRRERIGLDLICFTCRDFISKSQILEILCHFYPPGGHMGSPLTRCYFECPHCTDDIVLGRNVGDGDDFHVIAGAIQQFPAAADKLANQIPCCTCRRSGGMFTTICVHLRNGNASSSDPDTKNEAYPDALLDSPNDIQQAAKSPNGFVVY